MRLQLEAIRKDMKQKEQVEEAYQDAADADAEAGAEVDDDAKIAEDEAGGELRARGRRWGTN